MARGADAAFFKEIVAVKRRQGNPLRMFGVAAGRTARVATLILVVPFCIALLLTVWLAVQLIRQ